MKQLTWEEMKRQDKIAESYLLNYATKRKAYLEKRSRLYDGQEYIGALGATQYSDMPKGTDTGNPTASKAISLVDLTTEEQWIMTIENVHDSLSEKKFMFLSARRAAHETYYDGGTGRPGWVEETAKEYCKLRERLNGDYQLLDRKTAMKWWSEIVDFTVRVAQRRGCL